MIHSTPKPIILFDLDGTLVDSFADIHAALSSGLRELGFPVHPLEAVLRMIGHGMRTLVQKALPPNSSLEVENALIEATLRYYAEDPCKLTCPFPGMEALLSKLLPNATLGVLSNKPHPLTLAVVEGCGLNPYFQSVQGQREGIKIKPHPESLWSFLYEADRDRILLVGDGEADAQLSESAEIGFIGVSWGTSTVELLEPYGPVAHTMGELDHLLQGKLEQFHAKGSFKELKNY